MIKKPHLVYDVLAKKCKFKNMATPTFEYIKNHEKLDELESQWTNMLKHQLPALPPMESFWNDLEPFFGWLEGELRVEQLITPDSIEGRIFQVGSAEYRDVNMSVLNKIQFAAANRVCINLQYNHKVRIVEPLSFREANSGNKLFYGYERDADHIKAYTIAKIQAVEITNTPYMETSPVEISATGAISMPPIRGIRKNAVKGIGEIRA